MDRPLRVAILGSTGSIGRQALEVIALHPDRFEVVALVARGSSGQSLEMIGDQAGRFGARYVGITDPPDGFCAPEGSGAEWHFGPGCRTEACALGEVDAVLVAVVGFDGLEAVLATLARGKRVLLATKEAMVAGSDLIRPYMDALPGCVLPVDSEHSAIFQCLQGSDQKPARLWLTASGGPFRTWDAERIRTATRADALKHPNWAMGEKITVDSASMMNKGLEVIEACGLFGVAPEQVKVVVHPESILHSAVEWADGAVIGQMGVPDMRLPILYALGYPQRLETGAPRLDLAALGSLTFEAPDTAKFPLLKIAYQALRAGGTAPTVLNAANEEAVYLFLAGRIPFMGIERRVRAALERVPVAPVRNLGDVLDADLRAREAVRAMGVE